MAQVDTRAPIATAGAERVKRPSVLVILVVKDGAAWLPQCLTGLARQTHPRIGVLAVDNASADDSSQLLLSALGPERVICLDRNAGFAGAVNRALQSPLAEEADYVLLLHDDTILAPGALGALVDAAGRIDGVGVVGPKVLDWEHPQILREIGLSTDRFGYPYSPLEEGEIDQGQYDRIREVRYVSSCAMLVSREALARIGPPDERFTTHYEDLDLCWRAQLAGYRVLMAPRAVALHRAATVRMERAAQPRLRARYDRERAALACMMKNYGALSLVWILPLYVALGLGKMLVLAAMRRFEEAYQVAAAWGWNIAHLPGTLRRRVRAQAVRTVPDRSVRLSMAPAGHRVRKWAVGAGQALAPRDEETEPVAGHIRVIRYALAHPAAAAWFLAVLLALVAYRHLFSASPLSGGALGVTPGSATGYFRELVSGLRHTGLGGSDAASPALGLLGLGSVLSLGSPALLQKLLLLGLPAVAAIGCYRTVRSVTGDRLAAVVSGACYGLSSAALWAVSQGRIPVLILLAGIPWLAEKISVAFERGSGVRAIRWVAGAALGLAVIGSFFPGVVLAVALLAICSLVGASPGGTRRPQGIGLVAAAIGGAALLTFPLTLSLLRSGSGALADQAGAPSFGALARLSLGHGPGAWTVAFYLPLAAALSLVFVAGRLTIPAIRAAVTAIAAMYLAWLAAAGYLPVAMSNPTAYVAVLAFSYAMLVGIGLACLTRGVARAAFGHRQMGAALMTVVIAGGLVAQAAQAGRGGWAVGPDRVPPAYLVAGQSGQPYRVLWLGRPDGDPFPAPGGLPQGVVPARAASVRFSVTAPSGASDLDIGRPNAGPGYRRLHQVLVQILAGPTRHGGALLAPFGIRYIVAQPGEVPGPALRRLKRQLDLEPVSALGLTIFANPKSATMASQISDPEWLAGALSPGPASVSELPAPDGIPLTARSGDGFTGAAGNRPSLVMLAQQFDPRWRLQPPGSGSGVRTVLPQRAFGYAVAFRTSGPSGSGDAGTAPPGRFVIRFGGQGPRTVQMVLLVLLWGFALAVTRRPVRG